MTTLMAALEPYFSTVTNRFATLPYIAVGDRMFLGMHDFDFAQI